MATVSDEDGQCFEQPDEGGNTISLRRVKGRLWPTFPAEFIEGIETLKLRDDDVILVAYPKSGTHWVYEMIRLLLAGNTDLPVMEKRNFMLELTGPEVIQDLPSPRALNTHAHFEHMPTELLAPNQKCRLVYVTRDPRDVVVSYFNHHRKLQQRYNYSGQWKDYFPLFLNAKLDYDSWFDYTKGWEEGIKNHPELQVHVTSYEAFQENTVAEIEKLAKFLGASTEQAFLEEVLKKTSFDYMASTQGALHTVPEGSRPVMYRKGKVGDWKNWFTVTQSEQFDDVFEKEMPGTKAYELYSNQKQKFPKS